MTNTISKSLAVPAVGGLMFMGSAIAQQDNTSGAGPGVVDPGHPRVNEINQREQNQQDRIANGVKGGQLTPGETQRLERGEQRLETMRRRTWRRIMAISRSRTSESSIVKPIT